MTRARQRSDARFGPGILALLATLSLLSAQSSVVTMPDDHVGRAGAEVFPLRWKFHPEDRPAHADPTLDDRGWIETDTRLRPDATPAGWDGRGWFRLTFRASDDWRNRPLGWTLVGAAAAEVYLNGRLLFSVGELGPQARTAIQRLPRVVVIPDPGPHLLAVRFSNPDWRRYHDDGSWAGFALTVRPANQAIGAAAARIGRDSSLGMLFAGIFGAISLLHLALFAYRPSSTPNLYFAAYIGAIAALTLAMFQRDLTTDPDFRFYYLARIQGAFGALTLLLGLLFLYRVFYRRMPRWVWIVVPATTLFAVLLWFVPGSGFLFPYFALLISAEMIRVVVRAVRLGLEGSWLVGVGMAVLAAAFSYLMLAELGWVFTRGGPAVVVCCLAGVFLAICMSLHLAKGYGETQRDLELQLEKVRALSEKTLEQERQAHQAEMKRRLLEADNRRKTAELEEARRLQLSLLPAELPRPPGLDVAAHMQTATEVGGDYYDFRLGPKGGLTLVVGDATGHGMKAGMVVTATKSLFGTLTDSEDLPGFLRRASAALKGMKLKGLYMSLLVARFSNGRVRLAAAGMPPVLLRREGEEKAREIVFQSPPLGSFPNFPYREEAVELGAGDVLLTMSDGFAELFDPDGEMLGYDEAARLFGRSSARDARGVIEELLEQARRWSARRPPDDDMTFVVVRRNGAET